MRQWLLVFQIKIPYVQKHVHMSPWLWPMVHRSSEVPSFQLGVISMPQHTMIFQTMCSQLCGDGLCLCLSWFNMKKGPCARWQVHKEMIFPSSAWRNNLTPDLNPIIQLCYVATPSISVGGGDVVSSHCYKDLDLEVELDLRHDGSDDLSVFISV